jgi:hypothetical protein
MRDFADQLDLGLRRVADLAQPTGLSIVAAPLASNSRRGERSETRAVRPSRRRFVALTGVGGLAAVAASVVLLSGSADAGLPILSVPTSDASALPGVAALRRDGVDPRQAHPFQLGSMRAFVLGSTDGTRVCVAFPDPLIHDEPTYSGSCEATAIVERNGLLVQAVSGRFTKQPGQDTYAFVLPLDATQVRVVGADGAVSHPRVRQGVVTGTVFQRSELRYRAGSEAAHQKLRGPFS